MKSNNARTGAKRGPAAPVHAGMTIQTAEPLRLSKEQRQGIENCVPRIAKLLPKLGLNKPTLNNGEGYISSIRNGETGKVDKLIHLLRDYGDSGEAAARELADIVDPEGKRYLPFSTQEDCGDTGSEDQGPDSVDEERSPLPEPTGSQTAGVSGIVPTPVEDIRTGEPFKDLFPITPRIRSGIAKRMQADGYDLAQPLVVWQEENILLDGHTRLSAAAESGIKMVPVVLKSFPDEDTALEYAIGAQCSRRNLTDSEIIHLLEKWDSRHSRGGDRRSPEAKSKASHAALGRSAAQTATLMGISTTKVEKGRSILDSKDTALQNAVKSGMTSINKASKKTRAAKREEKRRSDDKPKPTVKDSNMYKLSVRSWNPFVGCGFDCTYCGPSFQQQAKRRKQDCQQCYEYKPHEHPERLDNSLPTTGFCQFIFTCDMGDISFCPDEHLERIVKRIRQESDRTFLIQSKAPATFMRVKKWPRNVILGTTIETNRDDLCADVSTAPPPSKRFKDLLAVDHPVKMITLEPLMSFDVDILASWVEKIHPRMVWLGYQNHGDDLPAPPLERVRELHWRLSQLHIPVVLKSIPTGDKQG
ncbi:MAG: DUF5131 family protein [Kiritimatiellae bacterium]|nr:DUF5131 family protein [Kiritimatiellia bacterium]